MAQPVVTIRGSIACPSCRLEVTRLHALGAPDDPSSPSWFQVGVARDVRGHYYVAPMSDVSTFAAYDSTGRLVRVIGRQGRGPGEYGFIMRAKRWTGDSLVVLDEGNRRLGILSSTYFACPLPSDAWPICSRMAPCGRQFVSAWDGAHTPVGRPSASHRGCQRRGPSVVRVSHA